MEEEAGMPIMTGKCVQPHQHSEECKRRLQKISISSKPAPPREGGWRGFILKVQPQSLSHQKGQSKTALEDTLVPSDEAEGARTSSSSEPTSRTAHAGVSKDLRQRALRSLAAVNRKPEATNSHGEHNYDTATQWKTIQQSTANERPHGQA